MKANTKNVRTSKAKLILAKETLRGLQAHVLQNVAGAGPTAACTGTCTVTCTC